MRDLFQPAAEAQAGAAPAALNPLPSSLMRDEKGYAASEIPLTRCKGYASLAMKLAYGREYGPTVFSRNLKKQEQKKRYRACNVRVRK
jgi:hypothetical protein